MFCPKMCKIIIKKIKTMEKLFKSKVAFIVFVILFSAFLFITYKAPFARFMWGLSIGGFVGFVFAQWYWKDKMDLIKHLIDERMASTVTDKIKKQLQDSVDSLKKSNENCIDIIAKLQEEIEDLKAQADPSYGKFDIKTSKNYYS